MRVALGALLLNIVLAGCADSQLGGTLFYLTPYKLDDLSCEDLRKRADAAADRVRVTEELRAKAEVDPEGPAISAMVYGPDYSKAQWERRNYEEAAARKNCPPSAPRPLLPPPATR